MRYTEDKERRTLCYVTKNRVLVDILILNVTKIRNGYVHNKLAEKKKYSNISNKYEQKQSFVSSTIHAFELRVMQCSEQLILKFRLIIKNTLFKHSKPQKQTH